MESIEAHSVKGLPARHDASLPRLLSVPTADSRQEHHMKHTNISLNQCIYNIRILYEFMYRSLLFSQNMFAFFFPSSILLFSFSFVSVLSQEELLERHVDLWIGFMGFVLLGTGKYSLNISRENEAGCDLAHLSPSHLSFPSF